MPAETWLREFIPYGTPCDEPCEPAGERVEALEAQIATLRKELAELRAEHEAAGRRKSGTDS